MRSRRRSSASSPAESARRRSTSVWANRRCFRRCRYFERAMERVRASGVKYTANAGDAQLRAAIARHYGYPGLQSAENVCITVGSQEAMYVAIKTLLDPSRDELLVVEPAFPSYVKMATLEGVAVCTVAMSDDDDFAFDPDRIAAAVSDRTRAIVICSPCNPTARVISRDAAENARFAPAATQWRTGVVAARRNLPRTNVRRRCRGYGAHLSAYDCAQLAEQKQRVDRACDWDGFSDRRISSPEPLRCMHGLLRAPIRSRNMWRLRCLVRRRIWTSMQRGMRSNATE